MKQHWKAFIIGCMVMFMVMTMGFFAFVGSERTGSQIPDEPVNNLPDTVRITALPPLRILSGTAIPFEGKKEFKQAIAGRFAKNMEVIHFKATGEHAEKSQLRIVWETGEVEYVMSGTTNRRFTPEKRAVEIAVIGYSMYERRVFKDSPRKGTLTWEIRYEPVEQ